MKMNEIMDAIQQLAAGNGFYGRLLRRLVELRKSDPEQYKEIARELEAQEFGDAVDMILYFEQ